MALRLDDNLAMVILRELLTRPYTHAHTSKGDNFSLVRDLDEKLCNELCEPAIIEAQPSLDAAFQGFGDKFVPSQCLGLGYKGWIAATGFGVVCKMAVRFLTGPVRGLPPAAFRDRPCAAVASTSLFGCLQKVDVSGRRLRECGCQRSKPGP